MRVAIPLGRHQLVAPGVPAPVAPLVPEGAALLHVLVPVAHARERLVAPGELALQAARRLGRRRQERGAQVAERGAPQRADRRRGVAKGAAERRCGVQTLVFLRLRGARRHHAQEVRPRTAAHRRVGLRERL